MENVETVVTPTASQGGQRKSKCVISVTKQSDAYVWQPRGMYDDDSSTECSLLETRHSKKPMNSIHSSHSRTHDDPVSTAPSTTGSPSLGQDYCQERCQQPFLICRTSATGQANEDVSPLYGRSSSKSSDGVEYRSRRRPRASLVDNLEYALTEDDDNASCTTSEINVPVRKIGMKLSERNRDVPFAIDVDEIDDNSEDDLVRGIILHEEGEGSSESIEMQLSRLVVQTKAESMLNEFFQQSFAFLQKVTVDPDDVARVLQSFKKATRRVASHSKSSQKLSYYISKDLERRVESLLQSRQTGLHSEAKTIIDLTNEMHVRVNVPQEELHTTASGLFPNGLGGDSQEKVNIKLGQWNQPRHATSNGGDRVEVSKGGSRVSCSVGVLPFVDRKKQKDDDDFSIHDDELRAVMELTNNGDDVGTLFPAVTIGSSESVPLDIKPAESLDGLELELSHLEQTREELRRQLADIHTVPSLETTGSEEFSERCSDTLSVAGSHFSEDSGRRHKRRVRFAEHNEEFIYYSDTGSEQSYERNDFVGTLEDFCGACEDLVDDLTLICSKSFQLSYICQRRGHTHH